MILVQGCWAKGSFGIWECLVPRFSQQHPSFVGFGGRIRASLVGIALERGKSLVRMTDPRSWGRFLFSNLAVYLLNTLKRAI